MPLTGNQQQAVRTAGKPLFIQAGAGTGKTFTLTKKIGYGLSDESGPILDGVDRLLTITFTNKAAAELLGRVRAELRSLGLVQAALDVDAAWVSTIHSMCRNILRAHALDAGIDTCAGLLSEEETGTLLDVAIDKLLVSRAQDPRLRMLLDAYGHVDTCALLRQLATAVLPMMPNGRASLDFGPEPGKASAQVLLAALGTLTSAVDALQQLGAPDTATCVRNFDKLQHSIDILQAFANSAFPDELTWTALAEVLDECPLTKGGNVKKAYKPLFMEAYEALAQVKAHVACACAYERLSAAVDLAESVLEGHRELKRASGMLDTNDLLVEAYRLLSGNPELAAEYRERFGSIMVDEFQDTDRLQVEIVTSMCDDALSTLTTVGDAQQSIYGFRGADLEVYREMRARMARCDSVEVALDENFRSHPDILGFVEDIFSNPNFFGNEFLKVKPGPNNAVPRPWHEDGSPRVEILLSAGTTAADNSRKRTSVAALRESDAELVAETFARYAENGAQFGEMAILMRSTNKAQAYLDALRSRGIPCMISGGSTFYTLDEVATLTQFIRVLENRDDDEALFAVLGSPMFDVSDDDLLALNVLVKQVLKVEADEARTKSSLFDALKYWCTASAGRLKHLHIGQPSALAVRAFEVLDCALDAAGTTPLSLVVLQAVRDSGWRSTLAGQGVAGRAVQANIDRFADLLDEYEAAHGMQLVGVAEHFRDMCAMAAEGTGARGKPGSMVSFGNNAVQIMTIHASKGLEFPIVAVVEFESAARTDKAHALALTEDGSVHIALPMNLDKDVNAYLEETGYAPESFEQAHDALGYSLYARELSHERAAQEEQRLLYVALTRARDTLLLVAHDSTYASKGSLKSGLFSDVAEALFESELPGSGSVVALPCSERVGFTVREVACETGAGEREGSDGEDGTVCEASCSREHALVEPVPALPVTTRLAKTRTAESYTSLATRDGNREVQADVAAPATLRAKRQESASPVGSAFHLVAEWMARVGYRRPRGAGRADGPLAERIAAAARRYGLEEQERDRLEKAVFAWLDSERYAAVRDSSRVYAEYPFRVAVGDIALEGYIDLLCLREPGTDALVVDYKTGTSGEEDELRKRYRLQACCYAYAVLELGLAERVELVFVRPEVELQEVSFTFDSSNLADLAREISK